MSYLEKHIILRAKEQQRILSGHPWIFSNEVKETRGHPEIGDVVEIVAANGDSLGVGFYNPHSLITARLLSQKPEEIDASFFQRRIADAFRLRQSLYPQGTVYRLVHGESDLLPGLVIDRFNETFAIQTFSFGMDLRLPLICDILDAVFHPAGIVERNESPLRLLDQLPLKKGILRGTIAPTRITEHDLLYTVDLLEGQKTGFFLDQRENRLTIRRYSGGSTVLDCFCNDGGFALNAARGGAVRVIGVDSSEAAIARARENAALNGLQSVQFEQADVFERLTALGEQGSTFDVIVLDPPSFTKSRKNVQTAKKGYRELHTRAFRVLKPGGFLLSASCSHHIEPDVFLSVIDEAARKQGRRVQLLDWRGAAPDHPTIPGVPETRYLKFGVFRVL